MPLPSFAVTKAYSGKPEMVVIETGSSSFVKPFEPLVGDDASSGAYGFVMSMT